MLLGLQIAVLLLAPLQLSLALYEDQAGTFDWYKQHVGPVTTAAFHKQKPRLYVGTSKNVVGCLNLRDGSIAWRRHLGYDEQLDATAFLDSHGIVVSLSQQGKVLRAWDSNDGSLRWEAKLDAAASVGSAKPVLYALVDDNDDARIAVVANGKLQVIDASKGFLVLKSELLSAGDTVLLQQVGSTITAVSYTKGSPDVMSYRVMGGKVEESQAQAGLPLADVAALGGQGLLAASADAGSVCFMPMKDGAFSGAASCVALSSLLPQLATGAVRLAATQQGFVITALNAGSGAGAAVLGVDSAGQLQVLFQSAAASVVSSPVDGSNGQALALVQHNAADGSLSLQVVSASSGAVLSSEDFSSSGVSRLAPGSAPLQVAAAYLGRFMRKDHTEGFRLLLTWSDQQVVLLQQGTAVWSRDEAQGAIASTLFVDLPAPAKGREAESELAGAGDGEASPMQSFLHYQLLNFKVQFKLNSPQEAAEAQRLRDALSDKNLLTRDVNGFRRILLALTDTGKVLALHNGDGHTLWAHQFDPEAVPTHMFVWKTFHDMQHGTQVAFLYPGPGAYVSVLDSHSGKQVERIQLAYTVDKLLPLHSPMRQDGADQAVFLCVEAQQGGAPAVHALPNTPTARSLLQSRYRSTYFWLLDQQASSLAGYGLDKAGAQALGASGSAPAVLAWQLALQAPLLAVAAPDPAEMVQSSVKVLGDRSIKYRYLNPNTIFIATGTPAGVDVDSDDSDGFATLTAQLVDSVTGRIIYRQSHPGARGPVTALYSEDMVVYQYWDSIACRFGMTSMELYDAFPQAFNVLDYLFNPNSTQPLSSFNNTPVEVLSLSFYARMPLKGMAVTQTEKGITSKQLLLATMQDQVYALDKRWLDPRRPRKDPKKLTTAEQEERLIPYQEVLPLLGPHFATYNKEVLGLRKVLSSPSRLESTCLVVAHGLDIFYTRLAPAKAYDSLEDDFAYGLLVLALVGLSLGTIALHYMVKQASLKSKWA